MNTLQFSLLLNGTAFLLLALLALGYVRLCDRVERALLRYDAELTVLRRECLDELTRRNRRENAGECEDADWWKREQPEGGADL